MVWVRPNYEVACRLSPLPLMLCVAPPFGCGIVVDSPVSDQLTALKCCSYEASSDSRSLPNPLRHERSDRNRRYRNKGGRKFRANFAKINNGLRLTPPFISSRFWQLSRKSGKFRANSAKFTCFRICLTYTPVYYTPVCSVPKPVDSLGKISREPRNL